MALCSLVYVFRVVALAAHGLVILQPMGCLLDGHGSLLAGYGLVMLQPLGLLFWLMAANRLVIGWLLADHVVNVSGSFGGSGSAVGYEHYHCEQVNFAHPHSIGVQDQCAFDVLHPVIWMRQGEPYTCCT